ncbi:MAG: bifunctional oligoribonuclease/PAP phosphatase NrnA [Phycisphaeraceae bacterium]|nr:bifunctional oligoribonuclease/PAP phosphatase NrnA [Phycisphaeraceae bacterium]
MINPGQDITTSASAEWATSIDIPAIAARLRRAQRVAILTHTKPDGDAIGSTLALARALSKIGVEATPLYLPPWPYRFDRVVRGTPIVHLGADDSEQAIPFEPDAVVVLDTGSWSQLGGVEHWLRDRAEKTIVIDHHLHGDADTAPAKLIDPAASAACEIVARLAVEILGLDSAAQLPIDIAEPVFMGIATDTGWFRHSNTTPNTLRLVADLLDTGVEFDRLYANIEQSDNEARLRLFAVALTSLEMHAGGRVAIMSLRGADFERTDAQPGDSGGFVEAPLSIAEVRVSAMVTETDYGATKISLRSKPVGDEDAVDVNAIAREFGGGGHARAAGLRIAKPFHEALPIITEALVTRIG